MSNIIRNNGQKVTVPEYARQFSILIEDEDSDSIGKTFRDKTILPNMEIWISRDRRLFSTGNPLTEGAMILVCGAMELKYQEVDYSLTCGHPFDVEKNLLFLPTRLHEMLSGKWDDVDYWWEDVDGYLMYVRHGTQVPDKPYYKTVEMQEALDLVLKLAKATLSQKFDITGFTDGAILQIWEASLGLKVDFIPCRLETEISFQEIQMKRRIGPIHMKTRGPTISDFSIKFLGTSSALQVEWINLSTQVLHRTFYVGQANKTD